jgi:hypothetical protein
MNGLCRYKNYFGKSGEGVHSYRIFDIAYIDVIFTILVAWLISHFLKMSFGYTLVAFFLLGIVMHRVFCVRTTIDKLIWP